MQVAFLTPFLHPHLLSAGVIESLTALHCDWRWKRLIAMDANWGSFWGAFSEQTVGDTDAHRAHDVLEASPRFERTGLRGCFCGRGGGCMFAEERMLTQTRIRIASASTQSLVCSSLLCTSIIFDEYFAFLPFSLHASGAPMNAEAFR